MTEKSWLWTGTATGDASLAPYEKDAFNRWFTAAHSLESEDRLYIVPGYLEDMLIEPLAGSAYSTIVVRPGLAVFKNYVYSVTENLYFTVDPLVSYPTTTLYRYDSLIIRLDREAKTVEIDLLVGTESATWPPTAPVLTQTDYGIYEAEIARITVDSTTFVMGYQHVNTLTRYLPTYSQYPTRPQNLIQNSEFMLIDTTPNVAQNPNCAACWNTYANVADYNAFSKSAALLPQKRGWSYTMTNAPLTPILSRIEQWIPLQYAQLDRANVLTYDGIFSLANNTVTANVKFEFYDAGVNLLSAYTVICSMHGSGLHYPHRTFKIPDSADSCLMTIYPGGTTCTFSIGEQVLSLGYFTGGFRTDHSLPVYKNVLFDAAWYSTAKSTGTTTINLAASFHGDVPLNARGIILYVEAIDSGSAAGGPSVAIYDYSNTVLYGTLWLAGVPNDVLRGRQFPVYINQPFVTSRSTNRGFTVRVVATGAATCDVGIYIIGLIT